MTLLVPPTAPDGLRVGDVASSSSSGGDNKEEGEAIEEDGSEESFLSRPVEVDLRRRPETRDLKL